MKKLLGRILTHKQKKALRRLYSRTYDKWTCKIFSNRLIIVLGCQRSGTTLLYMLLTAHQKIDGKDESESSFKFPKNGVLIRAFLKRKKVCYKLPTKTANLEEILSRFPNARIAWIERNPLSVVSSMKTLRMNDEGDNWLSLHGRDVLKSHGKLFPEINDIDFESMDQITVGATIWKYKKLARDRFIEAGVHTLDIRYEELLENPKGTLLPILDSVGLAYDDAMSHHERVHKGKKYIGGNVGDKKLDKLKKNPSLNLSNDEVEKILTLLGNTELSD